jgi:hypothetical protein
LAEIENDPFLNIAWVFSSLDNKDTDDSSGIQKLINEK